MRDDLIGIAGEVAEKIKLFGRQAHLRIVYGDPASDKIDFSCAQVHHIAACRCSTGAPVEGPPGCALRSSGMLKGLVT